MSVPYPVAQRTDQLRKGRFMAQAGFCRVCGQYVWLNDQWGCVNGHPWTEISNWYDPQTGTPITPYWLQAAPQAPTASAAPATPVAPAVTIAPAAPIAPVPEPPAMPQPAEPPIELTPFAVAPSLEPAAAPAPVAAPAPAPAPVPAPVPAPAPAPAAVPAPMPAPAPEPAPIAPAGPSDRLAMLADVLATLGQYPNYRAEYGTDTDIVIDNQLADANWGTGAKKVEFSAIMKAVEPELTIYYWEIVKESGGGLSFGGFDAEMTTTSGMKRSGTKSETVIGPGGVAMDYDWDYAATRRIVEDVAARHGWKVKVVLTRGSATW
jgi:hypothetical protein